MDFFELNSIMVMKCSITWPILQWLAPKKNVNTLMKPRVVYFSYSDSLPEVPKVISLRYVPQRHTHKNRLQYTTKKLQSRKYIDINCFKQVEEYSQHISGGLTGHPSPLFSKKMHLEKCKHISCAKSYILTSQKLGSSK